MEVICLQTEAFYSLIDEVVQRIKEQNNIKEDRWISSEEAMRKLRITSRTTLQKLRDSDLITVSALTSKILLYDSLSIDKYLQNHTRKTF
jgi:hypothetical protein